MRTSAASAGPEAAAANGPPTITRPRHRRLSPVEHGTMAGWKASPKPGGRKHSPELEQSGAPRNGLGLPAAHLASEASCGAVGVYFGGVSVLVCLGSGVVFLCEFAKASKRWLFGRQSRASRNIRAVPVSRVVRNSVVRSGKLRSLPEIRSEKFVIPWV